MDADPDARARALVAQALAAGEPTAWFERLYAEADRGAVVVPWDHDEPQQLLAEWAQQLDGAGRRAVVVGCGFGRDAEFVATRGFDTVAFDISATAVATARRRHAGSPVRYVQADLLDPPPEWQRVFDLVVESITVQALPDPPRRRAIEQVGRLVAPGGTLLVIALGGEQVDDGPPWALTRAEIDAFAGDGLTPVRVEDVDDGEVHRWRAEFRRPAGA